MDFYLNEMVGHLLVSYGQDPVLAADPEALTFDSQRMDSALLDALQTCFAANAEKEISNGRVGFSPHPFKGACFLLAMWRQQPLVWESQKQVPVCPVEKINALFAMELGWVVNRHSMLLGDLNASQVNEKISMEALVNGAVQEFRQRKLQAVQLLCSLLNGTVSQREIMLHYECMIHKMIHFPDTEEA
ncbi:MAG: hypothetical protein HQM06_16970 [Magnetococcales bacterium]|nr:hypothetical protein [Magnetococcales bacterium]